MWAFDSRFRISEQHLRSDNRNAKALLLQYFIGCPFHFWSFILSRNTQSERREEPTVILDVLRVDSLSHHYLIVLPLFDASRFQALDKPNYLVPISVVRRFYTALLSAGFMRASAMSSLYCTVCTTFIVLPFSI